MFPVLLLQLTLKNRSPPRTRLTRLVEEVESQRRHVREDVIRKEEKAKLQNMK